MIRLRIKEILAEQKRTKYWLQKQLGETSYRNLSRLMNNEVISIQDIGLSEKDFDNCMNNLIESANPEWKSGSIKTMEHANINLRENFNIFSNLEI